MKGVTLPTETVFVMENSPIKFGLGAMDEIGFDATRLGIRKALIFTDRHISELGLAERVRALLEEQGVKADVWDGVEVEPTDRSMEEAGEYARSKDWDGLIAVGGGSTIDTCKAANLLTCYPAPLLDYINKPVGKGIAVPGPVRPLIAVPTTAGTGSETTAVAVTHIVDQNVKAGVSHRLLRPALGVVDPLNTLTVPPEVTAAAGADILTHAIESYTTRPYNARAKHHPPDRPAYIGANPGQRHLVREGDGVRGPLPAARRAQRPRRRRAPAPGAGRQLRGRRLRQRGRAHPPRGGLSDRGSRARLRPERLSHPPPARPAWHVGDPHRARRLPLHLHDRARAPSARGRATGMAGGRSRRGRAARGAAAGAALDSCGTSASPTASPRSATPSAIFPR